MSKQLITLKSLILLTIFLPKKSTSLPNYVYSICPNTPLTSQYKANLKTLLNNLATAATKNPTPFYSTSSGTTTTDTVYGLYLCRGDQNTTTCTDCVTTATTGDIPNVYCPTSAVADVWYDECMVRYSNESMFGKMMDLPFEPIVNEVYGKVYEGNQTLFKDVIRDTMNDLVNRTANGVKKYETRAVNFTKVDTLYAMQQCMLDLSSDDCRRCLMTAIRRLGYGKGSTLLQPSCQIQHQPAPFYNDVVVDGPSGKRNKKRSLTAIAIIIPIVVLIGVTILCLIKRRAKNYDAVAFRSVSEDFAEVESLQFSLTTLQNATNNFSEENKLGEGGFGIVYKGKLSDGQEIAVKRLSKSSLQGAQEFKTEVLLVARLQHRRLVRLLGFCLAGTEKMLVYEYVSNRSLDLFLFDQEKKAALDWNTRYNIISGIARGILYLHQDSQLRIIHRDLKASNVLLDADMNPKISDFGMAKICGVDQTHGNTNRVVGTYGYMAPEYAMQGKFSVKSDVYSFGVLVLEIISGMKNNVFYKSSYAQDLLSYAWKRWIDNRPMEFVDEMVRNSCSINEVKKCMHLGLLCVQEIVQERPSMATVVLMLDGQSVSIATPTHPTSRLTSYGGLTLSSDPSMSESGPWTINDASVSEIEPR